MSPRRHRFDSRPGLVKFVVGKMAPGQVFLRVIQFSVPSSFHHCFIIIFVHAFLLTERQTDEAWESTKKAMLFRKSARTGRKLLLLFFLVFKCLTTLCSKRYCHMFIMSGFTQIFIEDFDAVENCKWAITQYNGLFLCRVSSCANSDHFNVVTWCSELKLCL
jgi:hypothetical protein